MVNLRKRKNRLRSWNLRKRRFATEACRESECAKIRFIFRGRVGVKNLLFKVYHTNITLSNEKRGTPWQKKALFFGKNESPNVTQESSFHLISTAIRSTSPTHL